MSKATGSTRSHPRESEREIARQTGLSRTEIWRFKLMAEIPEAEFEAVLAEARQKRVAISTRKIANYARLRRGDVIPEDYEHCPHCGEVIRRRD